jgi:hypothetical protein
MFQDSAGTTAVTSTGQSVGKILDKSGNGNYATQGTTSLKPTLRQDGDGKYYLEFDGVDDTVATESIPFGGIYKMSTFHGVRNNSTSGWRVLFIVGASGSFNAVGNFGEQMPTSGTNGATVAYGSGDTDFVIAEHTGTTNGTKYIKSALYDLTVATRTIITRINNVENTTADRSVVGTFTSNILTLFRNPSGAEIGEGDLYTLIIRGAASDSTTIAATETWINGKTGAY